MSTGNWPLTPADLPYMLAPFVVGLALYVLALRTPQRGKRRLLYFTSALNLSLAGAFLWHLVMFGWHP